MTRSTCHDIYNCTLTPNSCYFKEPKITSKEGLVRAAIGDSYAPLLSSARREYPERYPQVCGPVGIVLPRLKQVRGTGVELQLGGPGERFELEIGIFNPDPSSPHKPGEHTHVRYYNGTGEVLYIDFVYQLLWGDPPQPEAPIIEKYREDEIDQALVKRHSLFPFSEELARELGINLWYGGGVSPSSSMTDYHDMRAAMHDDRVFAGIIEVDSGGTVDTRSYWGDRTARLLRTVGQHALSS